MGDRFAGQADEQPDKPRVKPRGGYQRQGHADSVGAATVAFSAASRCRRPALPAAAGPAKFVPLHSAPPGIARRASPDNCFSRQARRRGAALAAGPDATQPAAVGESRGETADPSGFIIRSQELCTALQREHCVIIQCMGNSRWTQTKALRFASISKSIISIACREIVPNATAYPTHV